MNKFSITVKIEIDISPLLPKLPKARKNEEWVVIPVGENARRGKDYLVSSNYCAKVERPHIVTENDWILHRLGTYLRKQRKKS